MKSEVEKPRPSGWGAVTDHPMLFSPPMIVALLREAKEPGAGKTQTRRIIKPQPYGRISMITSFNHGRMEIAFGPDMRAKDGSPKWWRPAAQPGDRVWCRETWRLPAVEDDKSPSAFLQGVRDIGCSGPNGLVRFEADGCDAWLDKYGSLPLGRLRPSIHLPRELSRLTLYVSEVRVQRLQDISEADCIAEGAGLYVPGHGFITEDDLRADPGYSNFLAPRMGFEAIWTEINGPGSWQANPFVAAYTFVPRLGNIDTLPATLEAA